jgi:hypothetical protein
MKAAKVIATARWFSALALVVAAGAASIWLTESVSPARMTGWQRLHITLPILSVIGSGMAYRGAFASDFREKFYFCLAGPTVCFMLAIIFLQLPRQSFQDYLSIFISLPASMLLVDCISLAKKVFNRAI